MIRGVTIGKFLPFHNGHSFLFEQALKECDELHVILCDRPEWPIPAETRKTWIEKIHPEVKVHIVFDDIDDNDDNGWAKKTTDALGFVPDLAFTSEHYGHGFAKAIGCEHHMVDHDRINVNISATEVRFNPWAVWDYIHPVVRAYFVRRFCLVGPESTGKTTLAAALAAHYETEWVPEFARDYSNLYKERLDRTGFLDEDYTAIALAQNALEDTIAAKANKIMFCDTDSFAVSVWYDSHEKLRSVPVENLAMNRDYNLYFLMDIDVPFEDDGVRIGKQFRDAVFNRYKSKLAMWSKPYVLLSGDFETRFQKAVSIIDRIISGEVTQLPGLVRNAWHPKGGF